MERYAEYQDSGVEWIGEIPKGWKVEKLKYHCSFGKGLPITKANLIDGGIKVISYGQIHSKDNSGTGLNEKLYRYVSDEYLKTNADSLSRCGDFLFADTSEDYSGVGACALVDSDDAMFAGYHTIITRPHNIGLSKYQAYLYQTDAWRNQLRTTAFGVKVFSVIRKNLKEIRILIPSASEQQAIVSYLDAKCAVIDSEIARRQDIVAKCQEYRQSLITETVTHGLDPAAPMRDSGVEWIGKIPKGWKVGKLKYNVSIDKETLPEDTPDDCEFNYVDIGSVSRENGIEKVQKLTFGKAPSRARKVLHEGDVIVSTVRTYLKAIAVIDEKPKELLVASTGFAVLASSKDMSSKYLGYYVLSEKFVQLVSKLSKGVSYPAISSSDLANIKAIVPPLATQQAIVAYLDTQCAEIDGIIKNNTEVVGKLEELKKSLIFEVVTGKRRVG